MSDYAEASTLLQRFRIGSRLAKTHMSVVFDATDRESGQEVVVKIAASHSATIVENVVREIALLRHLRHPGVVSVLAYDVDEVQPWYATPRLQACSFGAANVSTIVEAEASAAEPPGAPRTDSNPGLDAGRATHIDLVRHVCDTLAWLHGRGVVHRDIKPQNILMDGDGHPVLIDFGAAARTADDEGRDRLSFELGGIGTPGYMAPEQRWGERVDARVDLYAIGCLLFEALALKPLYKVDFGDRVPRPSYVRSDVPPGYDDLVARLLARDPRERLAFAEDVARELEMLGATAARPNLPLPAPYLYRSGLVGCAHWLEEADLEHERADSEKGSIILIVGASGCGKTRLAQDVVARERRRGRRVIVSHCEGGAASRPLHGLSALLRRVALRCHADGPERAAALLPPQAHLLVDAQPQLRSLTHPPDDEPWRARRPELTAEQVRAAALEVLHRYAQLAKPLIVIDDVHWADELTLSVLGELAIRRELAPHATIVLTMRGEAAFAGFDRFCRGARVKVWRLDLMTEADVVMMIEGMTAVSPAPRALTEAVVGDCAGNPLFVVSYLRQAIHTGALRRQEGRWRFNAAGSLGMPRTLEGLLARRLEALDDPSQRLLEAMAVLGRQLDLRVAAALGRVETRDLAAAQVDLTVRHILCTTPEGALWFSHDKLREHTYHRIQAGGLKSLHSRAVGVLGERASHAERAHHFELGGLVAEAWPAYLEAAETALEEGRPMLARRMLANARRLNAGLSQDEHALVLAGRAAFAARDYRACGRVARRGLRALGMQVPTIHAAWALPLVGATWRLALRRLVPAGLAAGRDANARRASTIAYLYFLHGFEHQHHNRFLGQLACTVSSAYWAERGDDWGEASHHGATIAFVLGMIGWRAMSDAWFERAHAWARRSGDPVRELQCYTMQAGLLALHLEWERAERFALLVRARCLDYGTREQLAYNAYTCANIMWLTGRMREARHYAEQMVRHSRFGDLRQTVGEGRILIATLLLQEGDLEGAEREALDAADMLGQSGALILQANCMAVAAAAALRRGGWRDALGRSRWIQRQLADGGASSFLAFALHQTLPEVLLALAEQPAVAERAEMLARCDRAIRACEQLARRVWFLRPTAMRQRGAWWLARGCAWQGRRRLERAAVRAQTDRMPFEEAEALRAIALGDVFARGRRRRAAERARSIYATLGCRWHLAQLDRDRGGYV